MPEELKKNHQDFKQPVSTSGNSKWIRPPTHHQRVVGACPTGLTLKIKHLQGRLVVVFFFTPGRGQELGDFGSFMLNLLVPNFV